VGIDGIRCGPPVFTDDIVEAARAQDQPTSVKDSDHAA
jgi:hypothetical protein